MIAGAGPGGYGLWGGVLIVFGALMLFRMLRGNTDAVRPRRDSVFIVGLIAVGLWWMVLGGVFFFTAAVEPLASPIGAVVWTWLGLVYWIWAWHERKRFR